ncbi:hypothetical protein [Sorangium cellulosum]|uniref:hypothetical protein n=1 Tax=Sorangium cellulosum TaxID=56 RepID=UPI001012C304|nr:hypothetical protein [Sorangium cellulosum]
MISRAGAPVAVVLALPVRGGGSGEELAGLPERTDASALDARSDAPVGRADRLRREGAADRSCAACAQGTCGSGRCVDDGRGREADRAWAGAAAASPAGDERRERRREGPP